MDTEFFYQHLQCSRSDKQECLYVVRQLMELATYAHDFGLLDLDKRIHKDSLKYCDPFLRKAMSCVVDIADGKLVERVLTYYMLSGNYTGQQFLKNYVILETSLAIQRNEDLDHIFSFIVPSLFGLDFEAYIIDLYREYKMSRGIEPQAFSLSNPPPPEAPLDPNPVG